MAFLRRFTGILVFSILYVISFGQNAPIGTWRMYLPYNVSKAISDAGDRVYSAAGPAVFSYNKTTHEIQTYDKAKGLSDISTQTINYDKANKVLVVAYVNSNIDLIYNGTDIYNIPDIKKKSTTGAIPINSISFYNGDAYVSNNLGITTINLAKKEISNTYIIGSTGSPVPVYATTVDSTTIYAATAEGVKYAPLSSPNLLDFNSWKLFTPAQHIPTAKATLVCAYNGKVYAVISAPGADTLYEYDGTVWKSIYDSSGCTIKTMDALNGNLYMGIFDDNRGGGWLAKVNSSDSLIIRRSTGHGRPLNWFESDGVSWEGDYYNGLFKNDNGAVEAIIPTGPYSYSVFSVDVTDGVVNVAPGGVDDTWGYSYNRDGFFIYKDGKWVARNSNSDAILNDVTDILTAATVSSRGKTYFGSFFAGLIEYDNQSGNINLYDQNNSILEGAQGDESRTRISSLLTDRYNNLWIGNAGALKPLKVLESDGTTWKAFSIPFNFAVMKKIMIDQNDQLWAPVRGQGGGLLVWTYNQTLDDPSDDKAKMLFTGAGVGGLPDANVYCVAEDNDGNVWAGTDKGIAVFYCPGNMFADGGCDATQIKVERDGYIGYLFATESVRAIAVDAANRKWVGTTNGLWLISPDGKTELYKFNSDNSPMPANQVVDIAIDAQSGEVFIATTQGLVSFMGDAVAECTDCKGALVYPNPVKPGYDGPVAIKGLAQNAYVKITDVTGTLVYQGQANGSQMIWNARNYNGERVQSGVYLVLSSGSLGENKSVAKIMVMN